MDRRGLSGDMIGVYVIMKGSYKVNRELLFTNSQNTRSRGHPVKIAEDRVKTNRRKYFLYRA